MRSSTILVRLLLGMLPLIMAHPAAAQQISVVTIATELHNPRGMAVYPDGRLLVAEAGDGQGERETGGYISIFTDGNGDGDFDDTDERSKLLCCVPGYNTLTFFGTGQDEVGGLGDIALLDDGRIFYTQDDPLSGYVPDGQSHSIGIFGLIADPDWRRYEVSVGGATQNAVVYDPNADLLYVAESGHNTVNALTLDGDSRTIIEFPEMAHDQQPVPSGLALDPQTGEVLVALFSGQIRDYMGTVIAYMPEDARIVRLNPETGQWRAEITGLTTAVDVAIDELGNIYVVELATGWPAAVMPRDFPLYDPDAVPDAGGYPRFSGRVTMYPADGSNPLRLAEGLDEPTNITYYDGALYVSVGQGTPGRPIMGPAGRTRITGSLIRITGFR